MRKEQCLKRSQLRFSRIEARHELPGWACTLSIGRVNTNKPAPDTLWWNCTASGKKTHCRQLPGYLPRTHLDHCLRSGGPRLSDNRCQETTGEITLTWALQRVRLPFTGEGTIKTFPEMRGLRAYGTHRTPAPKRTQPRGSQTWSLSARTPEPGSLVCISPGSRILPMVWQVNSRDNNGICFEDCIRSLMSGA